MTETVTAYKAARYAAHAASNGVHGWTWIAARPAPRNVA